MFELKKKILGENTKSQKPTAIKQTDSDKIITDPEEIKKYTLEYCAQLLENKAPDKEYEDLAKIKKTLHKERVKEKIEN